MLRVLTCIKAYKNLCDNNRVSHEKKQKQKGFRIFQNTTRNFVFCNLSYATKKCRMQLHMLHATPK
jgi:hypothetical protein